MAHNIMIYGGPIHHAGASGDLAKMKEMAAQAEEHIRQHGDVSAALEALKLQIAKLEHKG